VVYGGVIAQVLVGLARGRSLRVVARQVGCSRGTVSTIAAGRHARQNGWSGARRVDEGEVIEVAPWRCPGCGGLTVFESCLVCRIRGRG